MIPELISDWLSPHLITQSRPLIGWSPRSGRASGVRAPRSHHPRARFSHGPRVASSAPHGNVPHSPLAPVGKKTMRQMRRPFTTQAMHG